MLSSILGFLLGSVSMPLPLLVLLLIVWGLLVAAGYRYMVKRNPAKLEQWAAQIKAAGERAEAALKKP